MTQGDALAVDDPTVDADGDGNYHDADATVGGLPRRGDTVRVVWEGSGSGTDTVTLAEETLG